jgi:hypothetical protein
MVSRALWVRVQEQLLDQGTRSGEGRKTEAPASPLAGKLFDESGEPLYVQGDGKRPASLPLLGFQRLGQRRFGKRTKEMADPGARDRANSSTVAGGMLDDRAAIALAFEESGFDPNQVPSALKSAQAWIERLQSRNETASALDALV